MKQLALLLSLLVTFGAAQAAELKVAYVDIKKIMGEAPQMSTIRESLNAEFKERSEQIKGIQDNYNQLQEKLNKEATTMTEGQRLSLIRQIEEAETNFKLKYKNFQEDQQKRFKEEQLKLIAQIQLVVQEYCKEQNYDMVFKIESLAWGQPAINISDKVLEKMNATNQ